MFNPKTPKVAIKDIARMCHVSTQTISRVLNHHPDVAPGTREIIEAAIARTGYRPSALARSLVQKRSYTLGVITAGLNYVGVSQTLHGMAAQCDAVNYTLLVKELPLFDSPEIFPVIEALIAQQVEGIIFAAPDVNENIGQTCASLPSFCPPIIFLKSSPNPLYTTLSIDNEGGARQAVEYLLALGRRRVGLISGPLEWLEACQRKQGWSSALEAAGEFVSGQNWAQGNWSSASGASAFAELTQKYPQMNAVFVSNDQMALGVLHYANAHGIRVPQDLAVVGFDDMAESAYFSPALTTVRQPLRELGILAVKTLLKQIAGALPTHLENASVLQTELVIRESTPVSGLDSRREWNVG